MKQHAHPVHNSEGGSKVMYNSAKFRIGLRLTILGALTTCVWHFSGRVPAQEFTQADKQITVETHQLSPDNGVIPVELKCSNAALSAPNFLKDVPCILRNNTNRLIKAVGITKLVTTEKEGRTFTDSTSIVIDAFVHPDINAERGGGLIPPGREINAGGLPAAYDGNIESVSLEVDYVEFDDSTGLGPNSASSRQKIADIRTGAANYKKWLVGQFNRSGRAANEMTPLLEREVSPEEMGLGNSGQEEGAVLYKNYARKIKKDKGVYALIERLSESSPPASPR